jgi:uncharacterized protein (DUF488 family)
VNGQDIPRTFAWSIGHSSHEPAWFIGLLRRTNITLVVDVRSAPYSRHAPQFNREALAAAVERAGMEYAWMGAELGGKREPPVSLDCIARTSGFRQGIRRLAELAAGRKVVIVCGEENPARCHRRMLITPALARLGVEVVHIRGDGRVQTDAEVAWEVSGGQEEFCFGDEDQGPG